MRQKTSPGPVKKRGALLKSNPPRDNWIEGDEIKTVSTIGEAKTSPRTKPAAPLFPSRACLENFDPEARSLPNRKPITHGKKYLSFFPDAAFHAEPVQDRRHR